MDINEIKNLFQIFKNYKQDTGEDLIYLDSASSTLTPDSVVAKMNEYYFYYRSNVDRSGSTLANLATLEYERSKKDLAKYLNTSPEEIIWTSGATMASNSLVDMLSTHDNGFKFLNEGDEILTTVMEHHSTLLPLQRLAKEKKLKLKFIELDSYFDLDLENLQELVSEKTKIVSITMASNVLGTMNDLESLITKIKSINKNIFVISDMTAAFGHAKIDLGRLSKFIDAGYFSLHKAFGPTGVGALWIKREISRHMQPSLVGGGIVSHVSRADFSLRSDIKAFEAGTSNIAGIIATSEVVNFLVLCERKILKSNQRLVSLFYKKVKELNLQNNEINIQIFAARESRNVGIVSFRVMKKGKEIDPNQVLDLLSRSDLVLRSGFHCAEPLSKYLGLEHGLVRVSFQIYNEEKDIDILLENLYSI